MLLSTRVLRKWKFYVPQSQLSCLLIYRRDRFMPVTEGLKSNSHSPHLTGYCCRPAERRLLPCCYPAQPLRLQGIPLRISAWYLRWIVDPVSLDSGIWAFSSMINLCGNDCTPYLFVGSVDTYAKKREIEITTEPKTYMFFLSLKHSIMQYPK